MRRVKRRRHARPHPRALAPFVEKVVTESIFAAVIWRMRRAGKKHAPQKHAAQAVPDEYHISVRSALPELVEFFDEVENKVAGTGRVQEFGIRQSGRID